MDDTGELITAEYVDKLVEELAPGVKSIVAGVKEENVKLAKEYLKKQVRKEWPSEFLTSDLMPFLAAQDGVEERFLKAAL